MTCQPPILRILVIALLLGGGVWLLAFSLAFIRTEQQLQQSSAVVEGRVLDSFSRPLSKGGQSLKLVVEYAPEGHAPITRTLDVSTEDHQAAMASGKARVTYLPADPQVSRVTHFASLPYWVLGGLGAAMMLAGIFCLRPRAGLRRPPHPENHPTTHPKGSADT